MLNTYTCKFHALSDHGKKPGNLFPRKKSLAFHFQDLNPSHCGPMPPPPLRLLLFGVTLATKEKSKGSFNNYVNKLRRVGVESIVYTNKVYNSSLFTNFVY